MFKKTKIPEKDEEKQTRFQEPKIKRSREIKTHLRQKTEAEKIFLGFKMNLSRKTIYRMILKLKDKDFDNNIYMITDALLSTFLADKSIDKMFYRVFGRIVESRKAYAIKTLCMDYLIAQLQIDQRYISLATFLIRHFKDMFLMKRNELLDVVNDDKLKQTIRNLKDVEIIGKGIEGVPIKYIE